MIIPAHQQDKINRIEQLFRELDSEIEIFKSATSLGCAKGCGRCCESPAVFVTVLEVLPLAYEMWNTGQAPEILKNTYSDRKGWCSFYRPDAAGGGKGRCGAYQWRPLICRLFGFSAKKDKCGQPHLVTCTTMKALCPSEFAATAKRLADGTLRVPLMHDYAMQVFNIDPSLGKELLPINEAVSIAIEKVGLFMREERDDQ